SNTVMSSPAARRCSTRREPRKPRPPVTTTSLMLLPADPVVGEPRLLEFVDGVPREIRSSVHQEAPVRRVPGQAGQVDGFERFVPGQDGYAVGAFDRFTDTVLG